METTVAGDLKGAIFGQVGTIKNLLCGIFIYTFLSTVAWGSSCPSACADCTMPAGKVSQPYKVVLYASLWDQAKIDVIGEVPPGLRVVLDPDNKSSPTDLVLVGTPTQPGNFTFQYKIQNGVAYYPGYGNYFTQRIQIACVSSTRMWAPATVSWVPIPIDDISIVIPVAQNLPPDPGASGDATVGGVDTNGNSLRDDVERGIVYAYPNNPRAQMALFEMATYYQSILANSGAAAVVRQNFATVASFQRCVEAATGDIGVEGSLLRPLVLNTYERGMAYIASLDALASAGVVTVSTFPVACP